MLIFYIKYLPIVYSFKPNYVLSSQYISLHGNLNIVIFCFKYLNSLLFEKLILVVYDNNYNKYSIPNEKKKNIITQ